METEATFDGNNIGFLNMQKTEDIPERLQEDSFSGIDGAIITNHGAQMRVLDFTGIITGLTHVEILDKIFLAQSYRDRRADLEVVFGYGTQIFEYCKMTKYQRQNPVGHNVIYGESLFFCPIVVQFKQLYWNTNTE